MLSVSDYLTSLAISPHGLMVAGVDTRGTVHLWDARTGVLRPDSYSLGSGLTSFAVAFDPSSRLIAATGPEGVRVWRLGTVKPLMQLPHPNATGVAFDPSGRRLVSTAQDGSVNIWSTRDGKLEQALKAHDRSRLVSASLDTTVAQFTCSACSDQDGVIREAVGWAQDH